MRKIDPLVRLRILKDVVPQIFDAKSKTPRFHIDALALLEERYRYNALIFFRGASKTTILNKGYVSTEIYLRQERYTQIVSKDATKAKKFVRDIRKICEAMMRKGYAVVRGDVWSDDYFEVIVKGTIKCVVEAIGAGEDPRGNTADFERPTLIVVDDLESKTGKYPVGKQKGREKLASWFYDDLLPGLHPTKGRVVFLGTILHKDSLLSQLARDPDWAVMNVPILVGDKSAWPSRFSVGKIIQIKEGFARRGRLSHFAREYMNKPVADENLIFKHEYFNYFKTLRFDRDAARVLTVKNALQTKRLTIRRPTHIVLDDDSSIPLHSCVVYTTMDVAAVGGHDKTAIVTCAYYNKRRYVLDVKSGYWDPFEKGCAVIETYLTYRPLAFGIEKGGMQNDFHSTIAIMAAEVGVSVPVQALSHGGIDKNVRIANMQPGFVQGLVYLNRNDPNTATLEAQLLSFDPAVDSDEDDEIDALAYQDQIAIGFMLDDGIEDGDDDEGLWT